MAIPHSITCIINFNGRRLGRRRKTIKRLCLVALVRRRDTSIEQRRERLRHELSK
jgi:hypothetical protein